MKITITGTPGVGKTTVAEALAQKIQLPLYNLSELVKEKGFFTEKDEKRGSFVVDEKKLLDFFKDKDSFIAEGLIAHYIPSNLCVVLRVNPSLISVRLKNRGYPVKKVRENQEAERLSIIVTEALELSRAKRTVLIDTTNRSVEEVVNLILKAIEGEDIFDDVDWLENEIIGNKNS
ncbi:MAG: adenylate kinase family protein [Desulfurobacteriaceae bacterium]